MMRLFVGFDFATETVAALAGLAGGIPGARWVPGRNLHLTLRFIGEVDETIAEDIHYALAAISAPAFALTLAGFGLFGDRRRAHALWLGTEGCEDLSHLARAVDRAVVKGGGAPDPRRFMPHVTLARLKDAAPERLQAFMEFHAGFRLEKVPMADFALFESRLHPEGPEYQVLERYPLRRAGVETGIS